MNRNEFLYDVFYLQKEWYKLYHSENITKRKIVDLCAPFRDKYNLTDKETLRIARDELTKGEILNIANKIKGGVDND